MKKYENSEQLVKTVQEMVAKSHARMNSYTDETREALEASARAIMTGGKVTNNCPRK